jgi:hypothetical protein
MEWGVLLGHIPESVARGALIYSGWKGASRSVVMISRSLPGAARRTFLQGMGPQNEPRLATKASASSTLHLLWPLEIVVLERMFPGFNTP